MGKPNDSGIGTSKRQVLEETVVNVMYESNSCVSLNTLVKLLDEKGIKFGEMGGDGHEDYQLGAAITNLIRAEKLRIVRLYSATGHEDEFFVCQDC